MGAAPSSEEAAGHADADVTYGSVNHTPESDMQSNEAPPTVTAYIPQEARERSVLVTNVPPSLNSIDLKGAFSAAGTIEFCEVSANGKAEITFQTAQAARQAVDTYNGGDLNGRSIKVTLM